MGVFLPFHRHTWSHLEIWIVGSGMVPRGRKPTILLQCGGGETATALHLTLLASDINSPGYFPGRSGTLPHKRQKAFLRARPALNRGSSTSWAGQPHPRLSYGNGPPKGKDGGKHRTIITNDCMLRKRIVYPLY